MNVETIKTISTPKRNIRNMSNIKRKYTQNVNIADIAYIAPKIQKIKTYQQQHDNLWQKAWELADWIDDSSSSVTWQERAAKVPELQKMSMMIDELEYLMNQKEK